MRKSSIRGIRGSKCIFWCIVYGPSEYLHLDCNTSRSRPPVRLPSLTFQTIFGSVKGCGIPAEDGLQLLLPWWRIGDKFKFNHCQRQNTESRRQQLSQFLPRDALQCKARYCDRMSSVRPSVRNVCDSGPHRLEISETNCTDN